VYCNSQDDHSLRGYSLAGERQVTRLMGHVQTVRDVSADWGSGLMASVAYDKTLRVWRPDSLF
jgi:WD40 repeat protein